MDESFAILRLVEGDNEPAIKGGIMAASKSKGTVGRWFRTRPELNYGIATGARSRIFVLDVDGREGKTSLLRLARENGLLPRTVLVDTPHGQHGYFRLRNIRSRRPGASPPASMSAATAATLLGQHDAGRNVSVRRRSPAGRGRDRRGSALAAEHDRQEAGGEQRPGPDAEAVR